MVEYLVVVTCIPNELTDPIVAPQLLRKVGFIGGPIRGQLLHEGTLDKLDYPFLSQVISRSRLHQR